jgi:hypothetical protein
MGLLKRLLEEERQSDSLLKRAVKLRNYGQKAEEAAVLEKKNDLTENSPRIPCPTLKKG